MIENWKDCRNILCVRLDNLGDLLMSEPAIRALKETLNCRITVLTSSMAAGIVPMLPGIDDCLIFDAPWVKLATPNDTDILNLVTTLRERQFDAAVIFTVFSQNPLPAALITYLAGIPLRLAYCRENPYHLLTQWVPDGEPYVFIRHQVQRDLDLVRHVGAETSQEQLMLQNSGNGNTIDSLLKTTGVDPQKPWLILHPGVSEEKRRYPVDHWIMLAKALGELGYQALLTGTGSEADNARVIASNAGTSAHVLAGKLTLSEFVSLIQHAPLVVSVNTATIHIAAATQTPVIVLYAMSNPQHTPWRVAGKVLPFTIDQQQQSRNEVIQYWQHRIPKHIPNTVSPKEVLKAIDELLQLQKHKTSLPIIPDNILIG